MCFPYLSSDKRQVRHGNSEQIKSLSRTVIILLKICIRLGHVLPYSVECNIHSYQILEQNYVIDCKYHRVTVSGNSKLVTILYTYINLLNRMIQGIKVQKILNHHQLKRKLLSLTRFIAIR